MQTLIEQSCKATPLSAFANPFAMTGLESDTAFVRALCEWAGMSPSPLAAAAGVAATTITRPHNGTATTRISQPTMDKLRARFPGFPGWATREQAGAKRIESDQPVMHTADGGETAPVLRLNLSYSMGPGTNLDDSYYVEEEAVEFDIGFLRTMTISPPSRIRIVDGIGDSMQPTLHDRDLLFVDINQRDLNAQDRIWAVWLFGLGAVKRLRAISPDKVLVISDNPDVKDQEVNREDILIHGRVIGSIKRH